ncbi:MAG TPA: hypothetical protein VNH64_08355, partial [Parvularculaceae bacterium]|nr:hypothetical protein [Parvularculaceae bacterium]
MSVAAGGAASDGLAGAIDAVLKIASTVGTSVTPGPGLSLFGIPAEFFLFGLTLLGVALFHHRTFTVAVTGLTAIVLYKLFFTGFAIAPGIPAEPGLVGLKDHFWLGADRTILSNLFLLLLGFAVLSRQFELSRAPDAMPRILPDDWTGGVALLAMILFISSFLDNIAAALIGGVVARHVYKGKVHLGYLAAIVAASNAGGAGSVVGDTTTTMMWIAGVSPLDVVHAYVGAAVAFIVFAIPISLIQQRYQPIQKHREAGFKIDKVRLGVVFFILASAIAANVYANLEAPELLDIYPVIGIGVWAAIIVTSLVRWPDWKVVPANLKGTLFLLALVASASLMPVERLPHASWQTAGGLGFVSAVFDNIPLTALALSQGGYDWGFLAYAVGFGGSMIWFGSSAGVALSNMYPEA